MANVAFTYLYRDGGNYKQAGQIVVSNPEGLSITEVEAELKSLGGFFIAHQLGIPEVFLWSAETHYDPSEESSWPDFCINEDDHCWHEFDGLAETSDSLTDPRTLQQLLTNFRKSVRRGWLEFQPGRERPE